jgi:hypothetical protein
MAGYYENRVHFPHSPSASGTRLRQESNLTPFEYVVQVLATELLRSMTQKGSLKILFQVSNASESCGCTIGLLTPGSQSVDGLRTVHNVPVGGRVFATFGDPLTALCNYRDGV